MNEIQGKDTNEFHISGLEFLIQYCRNIIRLCLVGVVLLTDDFLEELSEHLPYLVHLDLQQCPNITDSKLEDIVEKSEVDLEIVNYYGEIILPMELKADFSLENKDRRGSETSSTTEGAACSDEISDGLSDF